MTLDSDTNNADSKLHVEFYEHDRAPYKGVPFVKIMVPGDRHTIIDQPVAEHHKERFPRQWLYYQMKAEGSGAPLPGLDLGVWENESPEDLTRGQLDELRVLKFQTVEQVATASDAQLQRVGMSGLGLRERARTYLASRNNVQASAELADLKSQIESMRVMMADMADKKRNPGRPPRETTTREE